MGNSSNKDKKYRPVHTKRLRGHKPRDLIIIYSKYEDLISSGDSTKGKGLYIPQWIGTDYVDATKGISIPFDNIIICTYKEMADVGIIMMNRKLAELGTTNIDNYCKINRIFFFYQSRIMTISGVTPLTKGAV